VAIVLTPAAILPTIHREREKESKKKLVRQSLKKKKRRKKMSRIMNKRKREEREKNNFQMSKLVTSVLLVESSLFLSLFKKKKEDESRTNNRPTDRPLATNERKKQDVNGEVAEAENSFSSLSPFFTYHHFFFSGIRAFFGSYGKRSTTTNRLHPLKNRENEKKGHNIVTISMFIDTLAFLLTSKRVDKREKKERHSSFINNQGKNFYTFFSSYILMGVCLHSS